MSRSIRRRTKTSRKKGTTALKAASETTPLVSKYLAKLHCAIKGEKTEQHAYRGQADCYWDLQSTAFRRHEKNFLPEEFIKYNCNLVDDAKDAHYHRKENKVLTDIEMLAELRHYNAATALIDFTRDFLVALWFACEPVKEEEKPEESKYRKYKSGKIFVVQIDKTRKFLRLRLKDKEKSLEEILKFQTRKGDKKLEEEEEADKKLRIETRKPELWYWEPRFEINHRLSSQRGVFIFGKPVILKEDIEYEEIKIQAEDKDDIRLELDTFFGISVTSLFNDFHGYAEISDANHKILPKTWIDYWKIGDEYFQQGEWKRAIEQYDKAVKLKKQ